MQAVSVTQTRTFSTASEAALSPEVRAVLQEVGAALDAHQPLRVHNHGLVALAEMFPGPVSYKENRYERQGKRRPATRPRERSSRRQGPSGGSWSASASSRFGGDVLHIAYEDQLTHLVEAYSTLQTFRDDDGTWLVANSRVISGLARQAMFLVALPYKPGIGPRAWGFWTEGRRKLWIGPKHTNFQDGSICAFAPTDAAWSEGGDLRTLLDLYTVWALRHLHFEHFGRWPGKQYALFGGDPLAQAFYRLRECRADELCGCGSETRHYAECCKPSDERQDFVQLAAHFLRQTNGGFSNRKPPSAIIDFVEGRSAIPQIAEVHFELAAGRR